MREQQKEELHPLSVTGAFRERWAMTGEAAKGRGMQDCDRAPPLFCTLRASCSPSPGPIHPAPALCLLSSLPLSRAHNLNAIWDQPPLKSS